MFRSGIVLGLVFAIVSLFVFVKTLGGGSSAKVISAPFGSYAIRFVIGIVLGAAIPLGLVIGARLFVIAHAARQLTK